MKRATPKLQHKGVTITQSDSGDFVAKLNATTLEGIKKAIDIVQDHKMTGSMRAKAPNGLWIIGSADVIEVTALLSRFTRDADGRLNPNYDDENKIHWDTQTTKLGESKLPMYVDSDYNEWEEDRLILVEDDGDEDDEENENDETPAGNVKHDAGAQGGRS